MPHAFSRTELLIGKEALDRLKKCKVAVFGIGGVGSYVVEGLVRSGIGHFVLVDSDKVSLTNLNRQIIATRQTIGRPKVEVARDRILDINPQAEVEIHEVFYLPETAEGLVRPDMDYIVDAVDTVSAKVDLAVRAQALGVPVISCMGAGNKLDPTRFEVADLYQTAYCPLSKVMRRELKKRGVDHLKVVYSREEPLPAWENAAASAGAQTEQAEPAEPGEGRRRVPGSISFVPSVAGLILAGEVIKDLIGRR
ncbi:MAG TPA: tRNA cyclic N6-threonylcarbamoyladenosine(37) synthase TcdA [Clostridiales bacterium]|nr:tRNA cyclic N6-threonylcarbamoyladenosine(37) synthase TcdA [Clostridiales bacterium]